MLFGAFAPHFLRADATIRLSIKYSASLFPDEPVLFMGILSHSCLKVLDPPEERTRVEGELIKGVAGGDGKMKNLTLPFLRLPGIGDLLHIVEPARPPEPEGPYPVGEAEGCDDADGFSDMHGKWIPHDIFRTTPTTLPRTLTSSAL